MYKLEQLVRCLDRVVVVAVERAEHMVLNTYMRVRENPCKKRFTLIEGCVTATDGDVHMVHYRDLMQLYRVN